MPLTSCWSLIGASGDGNLTGKAASLVPVPVMLPSVCSKPGGPSSLVLGGDSLTDSVGHSELDHLWASSIDLKGTSLKGHCHGIWQLYKTQEGVFASIEFQN